jgi:hypothetical protein
MVSLDGANMKALRAKSCSQLLELTFADSFNARLERYRSPFAFRGMCADWPLTNSLQRLNHDVDTLRFIEKAMFRNFKKYAYAELNPSSSEWKCLSVAQHHGLPTRLLDWTFSPFVAMHFATNELDKMDKDGVLWMVNFDAMRRHLPPFFQNTLHRHYALTFSVEMLEADEQLADPFVFEQTEGAQDPFVMFFEPPSLDPRIVNQWGLFSFTNRLDIRLDEWLVKSSTRKYPLVRKIVIDANAKWEIRDKLDNMNMTERVLMPGLDGLSNWLKRWYSPKSPHPIAASPGPTRASAATAPDSAGGVTTKKRTPPTQATTERTSAKRAAAERASTKRAAARRVPAKPVSAKPTGRSSRP